ncbi:MAG: lipoate--protein ligase family protein [Clostridia bacterium]|nr:lipoate--protein ligase family protein [Clostridia bacterium]
MTERESKRDSECDSEREAESRSRSQRTAGCMWRIITSPPADGAANMAIDEAILEAVLAGCAPPTLRFYTWNPPCISIGCFQRAQRSADLRRLPGMGFGFVRRPTGGRAVLHADELTYAIAAPLTSVGGTSVLDSYLSISRGLRAGLAAMGIPAEIAPRGGARPGASAACFDSASSYEIMAGGRKIVGSAQTRRGGLSEGALLQQGAIPFSMDFRALAEALALTAEEANDLPNRVATLGEYLGENGRGLAERFSKLVAAITEGLLTELMKEAQPGELSPAEIDAAASLAAKYRSDEWNLLR